MVTSVRLEGDRTETTNIVLFASVADVIQEAGHNVGAVSNRRSTAGSWYCRGINAPKHGYVTSIILLWPGADNLLYTLRLEVSNNKIEALQSCFRRCQLVVTFGGNVGYTSDGNGSILVQPFTKKIDHFFLA